MFLFSINSIILVTIHEVSDVTVKTKPKINNNMTTLKVDGLNNRTDKNIYLETDSDIVETTKVIKSKNAMIVKDYVKNFNNNAPAHVPRIGRSSYKSSHTHQRNKTKHSESDERPGRPLFPTRVATRGNIPQKTNLLVEHNTPTVEPEETNFIQSHMVCVILFALVLMASIGSLIYVKRRRR